MTHSQEKKSLTEISPEESQTLGLLVRDVKSVLNMFSGLKETMGKELKEIKKTIHEHCWYENTNKEIEIIKRNQKIPEVKSIITKMKNLLEGLNVRSEQAKERINKSKIRQLELSSLKNRKKKE